MFEAVWSVEFLTAAGTSGNSIVIFDAGRIFGGNDTMICTGRYTLVEGEIGADVKVTTYAIAPGTVPQKGALSTFHLKVKGPQDAQNLFLTGHIVEEPWRTLTFRAVRRAELP